MTRPSPDRPAVAPEPAIPTQAALEAAHERLRRLGARVTQPRLCILACLIGSDDALTPPAAAETLRKGIAGAELATLPTAGHLANLEVPDAFNAAVQAFLKRLG